LTSDSFFGRSRTFLGVLLFVLYSLGMGIRLYDLTDPPLDFHPTRQLRSAIIARSIYYSTLPTAETWQRERAQEQMHGYGLIEPPVFENLVALAYRVIGSDPVWVARIYATLFWIVGGIALYLMTSAMTSPDGGILALAYYLFVPFSVIASRSFQPDPLMVMMIVLALWAYYRWYQRQSWGNAILAGILGGLALFIKAVAVYPIFFALAAYVLFGVGFRNAIRSSQVWVIGLLTILPVLVYHFYGIFILGSLESQFEGRFFPEMWRDPGFYIRWFNEVSRSLGYAGIVAGLFGALMFNRPVLRAFGVGLWIGYFLYGMSFPYHILTHSYYHLPLIPIIAITIAPIGALIFRQFNALKPVWLTRLVVTGILFGGILIKVWDARILLVQQDFHNEPAYWREIGDILGHDSSVVALAHDYGNRLAYWGWITPRVWLPSGHLENYRTLRGGAPIEVQKWFADLTGNKDYFLVTLIGQLKKQPELNEILYDNYAISAEGDGYIIFDLHKPLK